MVVALQEAGLLVALPTRLIANLDRVASVEALPCTPISEKGGLTGPSVGKAAIISRAFRPLPRPPA
jgi:hypothetical protein